MSSHLFVNRISSFIFIICLNGCSVYKSPVRKDFETKAETNASPSTNSQQNIKTNPVCKKIGFLPAWIEREFPEGQAELLSVDADFEAWKIMLPHGKSLIRTYQALESGFEVCTVQNNTKENFP
jgi:hypothetical protein